MTVRLPMKFDDIREDYDRGQESYAREVQARHDRDCPQEGEDSGVGTIFIQRRLLPSFARRLLDYLMDCGDLTMECREVIVALVDAIGGGRARIRVVLSESAYGWLQGERANFEAYLGGRYAQEVDHLFS